MSANSGVDVWKITMLEMIELYNFRGFHKLSLKGLKRVNLIVGKNNSGKTSLLEGIAALLNPVQAPEQFKQLRQLEEGNKTEFARGRYAKWILNDESEEGSVLLSGSWDGTERKVEFESIANQPDVVTPKEGDGPRTMRSKSASQKSASAIDSCVIGAQQSNPERLVQSFGIAIQRPDGEELLESALRALDPRIKKVRIGLVKKGIQVVVDIGLARGAVPISQVGQGIYRLVEIFSEIIGTGAQVTFIDEIENGIHHTCLIDVWTGIAEAARRFNVQVFATTHSHECIEAAHAAFLERESYDFGIIQLFREAGQIQGRVLDQKHITAAMAGDIDLRG